VYYLNLAYICACNAVRVVLLYISA